MDVTPAMIAAVGGILTSLVASILTFLAAVRAKPGRGGAGERRARGQADTRRVALLTGTAAASALIASVAAAVTATSVSRNTSRIDLIREEIRNLQRADLLFGEALLRAAQPPAPAGGGSPGRR